MPRVTLAIFHNRPDAELLATRLVQAGIRAEVHETLALEKLWWVSRKRAGARLEVPSDQFETAHNHLVSLDQADGALRDAIRCPECKSFRVAYPQFTRNSILPNVVMGLLAAIGQVEKEYYCAQCHHTWPQKGTKPYQVRPHGAPNYFIYGADETPSNLSQVALGPKEITPLAQPLTASSS